MRTLSCSYLHGWRLLPCLPCCSGDRLVLLWIHKPFPDELSWSWHFITVIEKKQMHLLITKSIKRNIQLSKVYTGEQLNNTGACWTVNLVFWIFTIKIFVAHICEAVSVRLARFYSHGSLQEKSCYWFHSAQAFPWQLVTMGWSSSSMTITPTTNNGLQASSIFTYVQFMMFQVFKTSCYCCRVIFWLLL